MVSYILHRHNPDCVFLTSYQNRSSKRNIDSLLQKWDLEGREIDWKEFDFDLSKYVVSNNDNGYEDYASSGPLGQEQDQDQDQGLQTREARNATAEEEEEYEEDDEDMDVEVDEKERQKDGRQTEINYWMDLALQEIDKQAAQGASDNPLYQSSTSLQSQHKIPITTTMSSLVDYGSSSSDSESDYNAPDDRHCDTHREKKCRQQLQKDQSSTCHKLGDGGALNSVHLLWICRRGRAESMFEVWKSVSTRASNCSSQ